MMGRNVKPPFTVKCDASNNSPEDVAKGVVNVDVSVPASWMSRRWTKKDIKTLCSQLDTFWLSCRPPTFIGAAAEANAKGYYEKATERRQDIVLAGLRGMREMLASRYASTYVLIAALAIDVSHDGVADGFARRATEQARETDKDRAAFEALVLRVVNEGLPDEVKSYDPTKR